MHSAVPPLGAALITTAAVAAISHALGATVPEHTATGVSLGFLVATYVLVLRRDDATVQRFGLSFGGLLAASPVRSPESGDDRAEERGNVRTAALAACRAAGWAVGIAAVVFPVFWVGFVWWWHPTRPFHWVPPASAWDDVLGQLLVIALPEEAFYRGYLQTAFDDVWKPNVSILGAKVGWAILVTAAFFAVGHFLTIPHPNRLAVFFPALLFGWLRARTGGVGAAILLHALANMFSDTLARGYGMFGY